MIDPRARFMQAMSDMEAAINTLPVKNEDLVYREFAPGALGLAFISISEARERIATGIAVHNWPNETPPP